MVNARNQTTSVRATSGLRSLVKLVNYAPRAWLETVTLVLALPSFRAAAVPFLSVSKCLSQPVAA